MSVITSLEAIAEKLENKRQTDLESILRISGSASTARNIYGITVVDDENIASSLAFKKLIKPKYDAQELKKAIDLEVKELKPNIPTQTRDLVAKSLYDEEIATNEELIRQTTELTSEVEKLNTTIGNLQAEIESEINNRLSVEQTNDALVNQLNAVTQTIDDFASQIQISLQKSVEESILRASLQSQNTGFKAQIQALIKQIDSLNSIIEGLQSQLGVVQNQQAIIQGTQSQALAAGADVVNDVIVIKVGPMDNINQPKIWARFNAKGGFEWQNGKTITITNNDKKPVIVKITKINPKEGTDFYILNEPQFTMGPGENKTIELSLNEVSVSNFDSKRKSGLFGGFTNSKEYKGGLLRITTIRSDGTSRDKTYDTGFGKYHPDSY